MSCNVAWVSLKFTVLPPPCGAGIRGVQHPHLTMEGVLWVSLMLLCFDLISAASPADVWANIAKLLF